MQIDTSWLLLSSAKYDVVHEPLSAAGGREGRERREMKERRERREKGEEGEEGGREGERRERGVRVRVEQT